MRINYSFFPYTPIQYSVKAKHQFGTQDFSSLGEALKAQLRAKLSTALIKEQQARTQLSSHEVGSASWASALETHAEANFAYATLYHSIHGEYPPGWGGDDDND